MFKDYYAILRVPFSASAEQIRASFKKLALLHHPDRTIHLSTINNFSKTGPLETNKSVEHNNKTHDNHLTHSASAKYTSETIKCKPEPSWEHEQNEEEEEEVHTIFANNRSDNVKCEHESSEIETIEQCGDANSGVEFTDVTEAYEVLSDVARRYLYDLNYVELSEICQRQRERENLQAQLALAAKKMKLRQRYKQYCEEEQNRLQQQQPNKQMQNLQEVEQVELGHNTLFNKEPCQSMNKCNPSISPILQTTSTKNVKNIENENVQDGRMSEVDSIDNGSKVPVTMELQNNVDPTITSKSNTITNIGDYDEDVEGKTNTNSKEGKYSNIEENKSKYNNVTRYNTFSENEGDTKINNDNMTEYSRHEVRINNLSNSLPVLVASKKIMSLPITSKSLNLRYDVRADNIYAATNSDRHIDVKAATTTTTSSTNRLSLPALKEAKMSSYTHHNINVQQRHQRAIRNTVRIFFARELGLNTEAHHNFLFM